MRDQLEFSTPAKRDKVLQLLSNAYPEWVNCREVLTSTNCGS